MRRSVLSVQMELHVRSARALNRWSGVIKQVAGALLVLSALALRYDWLTDGQAWLAEHTSFGGRGRDGPSSIRESGRPLTRLLPWVVTANRTVIRENPIRAGNSEHSGRGRMAAPCAFSCPFGSLWVPWANQAASATFRRSRNHPTSTPASESWRLRCTDHPGSQAPGNSNRHS
jgi:hypothetical protein